MNTVIQSYVYHGSECFFVSTINRTSSAREAYDFVYSETLVWEYSLITRDRGSLLYQLEDVKDSMKVHIEACQKLFKCGTIIDDTE